MLGLDRRRDLGQLADQRAASGRVAVEADLDEAGERAGRRGRAGAARAALPRARTRRTRSTECTTLAYLTTLCALLVCSWPMKCQRTGADVASATAAALGAASWSRFSPKSVRPRLGQGDHVGGGPGLGDGDERDLADVPSRRRARGGDPGPRWRRGCPPAQRAGRESLEEVGDIQVVVLFEDHRATTPGAHVEDRFLLARPPGVLPAGAARPTRRRASRSRSSRARVP